MSLSVSLFLYLELDGQSKASKTIKTSITSRSSKASKTSKTSILIKAILKRQIS